MNYGIKKRSNFN
jgi:hypothetical protein